jgi:hypothetical protein
MKKNQLKKEKKKQVNSDGPTKPGPTIKLTTRVILDPGSIKKLAKTKYIATKKMRIRFHRKKISRKMKL